MHGIAVRSIRGVDSPSDLFTLEAPTKAQSGAGPLLQEVTHISQEFNRRLAALGKALLGIEIAIQEGCTLRDNATDASSNATSKSGMITALQQHAEGLVSSIDVDSLARATVAVQAVTEFYSTKVSSPPLSLA